MKAVAAISSLAVAYSMGAPEMRAGGVYIREGTSASLSGCLVEVHHTCVGADGKLVALVPDCGGEYDWAGGMGVPEGDCFLVGDDSYCVEHVELGEGAVFRKRVARSHHDVGIE